MLAKFFGYVCDRTPSSARASAPQRAKHFAQSTSSAVELPTDSQLAGVLAGDYTARAGNVVVAVTGLPQWTIDAPGSNPAEAVLNAYQRIGERFLDHVRGRFALALVDGTSRTVLVALDPMGIERVTYAAQAAQFVFCDRASVVARFPGVDARLRGQSIFDYLLLHIVPAPETVYDGVFKLRPGTVARYAQGAVQVRRFWTPRFVESSASFPELKEQLHAALRKGVERAGIDAGTGAFLSGGLDSSSVAGMLSAVRGDGAPTYSMGFGVDTYDELAYARIASKRFKTKSHEYHVTPEDIVDAFPKIAGAYDEPFGNSSAVPTYMCAKFAAQHGSTHLLAGDGGDELFGGNERYVRQRVFEAYFRIPGWIRGGLIHPVSRMVSPDSSITPLRKLRSYVDQASVRLPERLETWNLVYREGAAKLLDPQFLATIDSRAPFKRMQEVYEENGNATMLNKMLFYDWHYTLSDNDLRKVGAMCSLAGIKVSYPMLDADVVDLSLRIPSAMKIQGVELRSFYKKAMADFLPHEIINKQKHGFGLPFGVWLKTHRQLGELIFGHLESLRRRKIVSSKFIDDIVIGHRDGDASFYGYPIWDMAMLDAWLTAHEAQTE